jgi:hypothetical protein
MRDSFRFLTGDSDGGSKGYTLQTLCYDALIALVNDGNRIETTITPFYYTHNNRNFRIVSLSLLYHPPSRITQYRANIEVGRYTFDITYNKSIIIDAYAR